MSQVTSKNPSDLEIMMYLDGELSEIEGKAVEQWLAKDSAAALKAKALGQIGDVLRTSVELHADAAENKLAGLWAGIDSAIQAQPAEATTTNATTTNATRGSATVDSRAAQAAEDRATDALIARTSWFAGWQGHVVTGAFAGVVVAVLMFVMRPERVIQTQTLVKQQSPAPVTFPVALESQEPEVEELEVYDGTGIIMTVHGDSQTAGDSSAVIWISNDTDVVEDPI